MKDILRAPKLFSKVELNASSTSFGKSSDAVHLLTLGNSPFPCYQTVFGSSDIAGDIRSAIDRAFTTNDKVEHDIKMPIMLCSLVVAWEPLFATKVPLNSRKLAIFMLRHMLQEK